MNIILYEVKGLKSAREFLSSFDGDVILTNGPGSTRHYGMLVLDYIFNSLKEEYPQVKDVKLKIEADNAAYFTAVKLGYKFL